MSAKGTQKKVSEVDYRIRLHEWANIPDLHANALARKVNDQLSDVSLQFIWFANRVKYPFVHDGGRGGRH